MIVGHDWGGAIAWAFAGMRPEMTDKLIIVNLPHMAGLVRELMREDSAQHRNSSYARMFQREESHKALSATMLASMVAGSDPEAKAKYIEAFERSSLDAMMNYYRRNYPREPYQMPTLPKIQAPVLQFHGLGDTALLAPALNDTWEHLTKDWTLVTPARRGALVTSSGSRHGHLDHPLVAQNAAVAIILRPLGRTCWAAALGCRGWFLPAIERNK